MISETQQDQAALYALDLLGAEEVIAFERELSANAELQTLVRELRDAGAAVALSVQALTEDGQAAQTIDHGGEADLNHQFLGDIAVTDVGGGS